MKESFNANVLYLMRYTGLDGRQENIKRLRSDLLKEKIYLVFYHEMNQAKTLAEDFGCWFKIICMAARMVKNKFAIQKEKLPSLKIETTESLKRKLGWDTLLKTNGIQKNFSKHFFYFRNSLKIQNSN
jgi:hypothetical protein